MQNKITIVQALVPATGGPMGITLAWILLHHSIMLPVVLDMQVQYRNIELNIMLTKEKYIKE